MIRLLRGCRTIGLGTLVLLALGFLPASVCAEVLAFRNDTTAPIIVQGAAVVQKNVQRDRPRLLQPGEACQIALPGHKLIIMYNPKMPNQVLFQTTIPAGPEDLYFSVRHSPVPGKVTIERVKPPPPKQ